MKKGSVSKTDAFSTEDRTIICGVLVFKQYLTRATNLNTFYNVVAQDGADPGVYKHTDEWYYFTRTTGGEVRIWRSCSLTSLDAGESRIVWGSPNFDAACRGIWAPELHYVQSRL